MASFYHEMLNPEPVGPVDGSILKASVVLWGSDFDPYLMRTWLVSFTSDVDCVKRLRALAAQSSLVIALPGSRRELLYRNLPQLLSSPLCAPVVIVTDDPAAVGAAPLARPARIVKALPEDLLGSAMSVFRMMACLMAPSTYACTDPEDIEAAFARGSHAQLCVPYWSPGTGLVFASPEEKEAVDGAKGAIVQVDFERFGSISATSRIFGEIRRLCSSDAVAILLAPERMFTMTERCSPLQPVPILATR